jgi:hypothetical protein
MRKSLVIESPKHKCEFCDRVFSRESTILSHVCETKQRWLNRDLQGNRIGFQVWVQFYKKNSAAKKTKTYEEFIRSPYYVAFAKFGNYCVDINCVNISRFTDWLLKNQIRLDTWCSDTHYTKFLIEYVKTEDPLDSIHRSVETTIKLGEDAGILPKDVLRFGNVNRICQAIVTGKISPWMLYQSNSGVKFLDTLTTDHAIMIMDYINPEQWALKFHREPENVTTVKEILNAGGY